MWPESFREYKENIEKTAIEQGILIGEEKGRFEGEQLGIAKGKQLGMVKGEQLKAIKTAKNMLQSGLLDEDIAKFTELSFDQIKQIKKRAELKN